MLFPLPENVSTYGPKLDTLFFVILGITGFFFFLTEFTLLWFILRYRETGTIEDGHDPIQKDKKRGKPYFIRGNKWAEVIWTVIPGAILLFLAFYSASLWSQIKKQMPDEKDAVVIEVMARQFAWIARYPGPDGKFGSTDPKLASVRDPFGRIEEDASGKDDIVTMNDIHAPVRQPILIKLSSRDVVHSLFIPNLRVKQDAVPGIVVPVWFEATKDGQYEIACAELCGAAHYLMRGILTVHTQDGFKEWLMKQNKWK